MFRRVLSSLAFVPIVCGCTLLFSPGSSADEDAASAIDAQIAAGDASGSDASPSAWSEPGFTWRLPFTLKSPVAEDLSDFPVLLSIDITALQPSLTELPGISKIKLVHNNTLVAMELDTEATSSEINLWFKADLVQEPAETYYLYFDDTQAGDLGEPSVWSTYESRWGFAEPMPTNPTYYVSSNQSYDAEVTGGGVNAVGKLATESRRPI